jgi:hypothetical protein
MIEPTPNDSLDVDPRGPMRARLRRSQDKQAGMSNYQVLALPESISYLRNVARLPSRIRVSESPPRPESRAAHLEGCMS